MRCSDHAQYAKGCEVCKQWKLKERIKRGDIDITRTHLYKKVLKKYGYPKTIEEWCNIDADAFWVFYLAKIDAEV